jgi:hypothetical protein
MQELNEKEREECLGAGNFPVLLILLILSDKLSHYKQLQAQSKLKKS